MVVGGRRRLPYGVVGDELEGFVSSDSLVNEFVSRYKKHPNTLTAYAGTLFTFFRWLRVRKDLKVTGEELLNLHSQHRGSKSIEDRRWGLRLALEFSRDNPDLKSCSDRYRYQLFNVVKQFFDTFETPLSSADNIYGKVAKRKFRPKQISVDDAKRMLGYFNVRDRAILLVMLQSGMAIGDVLNKFSPMLQELKAALQGKAKRFRVDFSERKGNDFQYFTFISQDALDELKKWLMLRESWLEGKSDPGTIFISKPIALHGQKQCNAGRPLTVLSFEVNFIRVVRKVKMKDGPWSVTPHMFRKLFKTESRAPERNVDQDIVEFMMGHSSGIQAVGGVYDKTPELHSEIVEKEYSKLEPYLNLYSGRVADSRFTDVDRKVLDLLSDPEVFRELEDMLKKRKEQG
jgi:integrase